MPGKRPETGLIASGSGDTHPGFLDPGTAAVPASRSRREVSAMESHRILVTLVEFILHLFS
jgi:hypothetical protein